MAGTFVKGALIQFMDVFGVPLPNVVVFQFNPESMTHAWTQAEAASTGAPTGGTPRAGGPANPLAVKSLPGETFTFQVLMDANEDIADENPVSGTLAQVSGVYSRIAAIEMLQYPVPADAGDGLVGSVSAGAAGVSVGGAAGGTSRPVPQSQVPTVLFVWGPGRIVPVRVTSLSITERQHDALLNPLQVSADLSVRVLTPEELRWVSGPLASIARGAYEYSQGLRKVLAVANLGNAAESIIGMLPV